MQRLRRIYPIAAASASDADQGPNWQAFLQRNQYVEPFLQPEPDPQPSVPDPSPINWGSLPMDKRTAPVEDPMYLSAWQHDNSNGHTTGDMIG